VVREHVHPDFAPQRHIEHTYHDPPKSKQNMTCLCGGKHYYLLKSIKDLDIAMRPARNMHTFRCINCGLTVEVWRWYGKIYKVHRLR